MTFLNWFLFAIPIAVVNLILAFLWLQGAFKCSKFSCLDAIWGPQVDRVEHYDELHGGPLAGRAEVALNTTSISTALSPIKDNGTVDSPASARTNNTDMSEDAELATTSEPGSPQGKTRLKMQAITRELLGKDLT